MSFTASDRPMPLAESERQVENARAWRNAPAMSALVRGPAAGGEDLGGLLEVRVQRRHGVAGEVDELGVAQHVAEHRLGALVVGVELVEGSLESLAADRESRASRRDRATGGRRSSGLEHAANRSASVGKWR